MIRSTSSNVLASLPVLIVAIYQHIHQDILMCHSVNSTTFDRITLADCRCCVKLHNWNGLACSEAACPAADWFDRETYRIDPFEQLLVAVSF